MDRQKPYRIIISGGGTGGHIFPAIAIANHFRDRYPHSDILFVGAQGRMEMTRVPEAGYKIIGLWISGLQRRLTISNLMFPVKVMASYVKAANIIRSFRPDAVVGTGGYASGPIMMAATAARIPSVIQEQNSFAGITNKRIGRKASVICVAYEGMEKFFPKEKIVYTGNPVRSNILRVADKRQEGLAHFGLDAQRKTLLAVGGSLGSRTINESIYAGLEKLSAAGVQVIWQTGKAYHEKYIEDIKPYADKGIRMLDFVKEMDLAYAAADVVISRSGALAVSELCVAGKACILVPSPNVAEDHQTRNALALVDKNAAVLVRDSEAHSKLVDEALRLLHDPQRMGVLQTNVSALAKPDATEDIVREIEKLIEAKE